MRKVSCNIQKYYNYYLLFICNLIENIVEVCRSMVYYFFYLKDMPIKSVTLLTLVILIS